MYLKPGSNIERVEKWKTLSGPPILNHITDVFFWSTVINSVDYFDNFDYFGNGIFKAGTIYDYYFVVFYSAQDFHKVAGNASQPCRIIPLSMLAQTFGIYGKSRTQGNFAWTELWQILPNYGKNHCKHHNNILTWMLCLVYSNSTLS